MSYEPTIIVERKDLIQIEDELQRLADLEDDRVAKYLCEILRDEPCDFKNMQLDIFQPECSGFNLKVREWLSEHNIEYGEDN